MKPTALKFLVCPACKAELEPRVHAQEGLEVLEGSLSCLACRAEYPILRGVPRFVTTGAYASSFGSQWNWFRTVQLDSFNGTKESERTLAGTTGWAGEDND